MTITFTSSYPVAQTMCFEQLFEPQLRSRDIEEKREFLSACLVLWMFVNGRLAGEIYGKPLRRGSKSLYCWSTAVLAPYQSQGLAKILVAMWNGMAKAQGYRAVTGHVTCPAMKAIRKMFGAKFSGKTLRWYGTPRTAYAYRQRL